MSDQVDLNNCDREPIHIPGSIQPHAVVLVLEEGTLSILQASANAPDRLGLEMKHILKQPGV